MNVLRDFDKRPPQEPPTTLAALVRDFRWRFPDERRDMTIPYTASSGDFVEAAQRAAYARNAQGKQHNHQSRIPQARLEKFARVIVSCKLRITQELNKTAKPYKFDKLYDILFLERPEGIGPVCVYDTSVRLGAFLGVEPCSLYLHAGVRLGLRALYEVVWADMPKLSTRIVRSADRIPLGQLPLAFSGMKANDVEDFLCTYREAFALLKGDVSWS